MLALLVIILMDVLHSKEKSFSSSKLGGFLLMNLQM
jgi:hypothetical protein